jgi:hypothetical protein
MGFLLGLIVASIIAHASESLISSKHVENFDILAAANDPPSVNVSTGDKNASSYISVNTHCSSTSSSVHFAGFSKLSFENSSWCPHATCLDSDICHPCSRRYLIILATGRSASTTLTWMMNELPGVRMSGENNDELHKIHNMIQNIATLTEFKDSTNQHTAWGHNEVPAGAYACVAQKMIETINPPKMIQGKKIYDDSNTIVGFKTIRGDGNGKVEETVDFLTRYYPCARFLVNIRSDIGAQADSLKHTWAETSKKDDLSNELKMRNARLQHMAELLGEQAYLLDSTEWTRNVSKLNDAIKWLGFTGCSFTELLEFNTEGNGYGTGRIFSPLSKACRYSGG